MITVPTLIVILFKEYPLMLETIVVGAGVAVAVGAGVAVAVGTAVGIAVGTAVGVAVGKAVGVAVGTTVELDWSTGWLAALEHATDRLT